MRSLKQLWVCVAWEFLWNDTLSSTTEVYKNKHILHQNHFHPEFNFLNLFMTTLGLRRCTQASHGSGFSCRGPRALSVGLQLLWPRLSCSKACAIFPNQGSNLCPPHWLVDSQPLDHQEVPIVKDTSQGYLLEIRVLTFSEGCFHFKKNFQTPVLLCCVQRLVSLWVNIFRKCYKDPKKTAPALHINPCVMLVVHILKFSEEKLYLLLLILIERAPSNSW